VICRAPLRAKHVEHAPQRGTVESDQVGWIEVVEKIRSVIPRSKRITRRGSSSDD
jgi:hypothetical protein